MVVLVVVVVFGCVDFACKERAREKEVAPMQPYYSCVTQLLVQVAGGGGAGAGAGAGGGYRDSMHSSSVIHCATHNTTTSHTHINFPLCQGGKYRGSVYTRDLSLKSFLLAN